MSPADAVLAQIDAAQEAFIARLARAVAIPSVSASLVHRTDVCAMADFLLAEFRRTGADARLAPLGKQTLEGQQVDLPPAVLAQLGTDPAKRTILIYGVRAIRLTGSWGPPPQWAGPANNSFAKHYDVQPALKSDGWDTEPFELSQDDKGRMWGRGATDDKGPVLGWFNVIDAYQQAGVEIPVNLKFCLEGMEESGSVGLDELIAQEKDSFLAGTDAICISDNYWLGNKPCLTHGLRGVQYFMLTVEGPGSDLHSGLYGGMVYEPMTDLLKIMSQLVTSHGEILVPGIKELVAPLTGEEAKRYEAMDFSVADFEGENVKAQIAVSDEKEKLLMSRMRFPSLSLHGVEGAFYESGQKTVIPAKVTGKFSLRLVPDMTPDKVVELVTAYINSLWAGLGSRNRMTLDAEPGGKPWLEDPEHWNYAAAFKAIESVYGVAPDLTREGGSIPVALSFSETLKKNLLLLPMGRADDGAHSIEKIDLTNFIEGSKVMAQYLHEVATISTS